MKSSFFIILISFIFFGCNENKKIFCCNPVNPISTFNLDISEDLPEEVNFLIQINDALERYKNKNYEYPAFKDRSIVNNQMFGRAINYEGQLFTVIKPYCEKACQDFIDNSSIQYKTGYISNGAQYKLLFFDKNLCEAIKIGYPLIINPQTYQSCSSIGFWTSRATYW